MKPKSKPSAKPTTIAGYLAALTPDKRAALQHLRKTILAAAPRAEECISYGLPAYRLDGRMLVWFGADLKEFRTSKGTIRFQPDHPLPAALVRKLVKARIAKIVPPSGRPARSGRRIRP
jgi:uncharacterized protein YdhG (YjbR/CyaY superfamily)